MTIEQITTMLAKPGFKISQGKHKFFLDCPDDPRSVACDICVFANSNGGCTIIGRDSINDKQLAELQITHPEQFI